MESAGAGDGVQRGEQDPGAEAKQCLSGAKLDLLAPTSWTMLALTWEGCASFRGPGWEASPTRDAKSPHWHLTNTAAENSWKS